VKIGFFTDSYLPTVNGASTAVDFTYRNLIKKGHKVHVVSPRSKGQQREENISALWSFAVNKIFDYRFAFITPRIFYKLLREKFDIIHGHVVGPISFMGHVLAGLKKVPYVYTYHTMLADYGHYLPFGILTPERIKKISVSILNHCDILIAPSRKVKNELIRQGIKKPVVIIPTGIKTEKFNISDKNYLREKFNLKKDNKILLYAGRLGKEKSVDFLIHTFKFIVKKEPKAHLIIVGTGPEMDFLKNLSRDLGISTNIHFAGLIQPKDMPFVYNGADMFIFSSTTETQGLVVLEAMAAGLPIVTVNDEALMETLENNVDGVIVEKNESKFAEEVLKLLKDESERKRLGVNARKKAVAISKSSVEKLEKVYRDLLAKPRFS
jgi:1,2-diacylglycerol 3-alpha-glucosyltransferase